MKKSFEVIEINSNKQTPRINVFNRDITYLKAKDVRRAMSKLISQYCKGNVLNEDAKTLTHMFSTYIQILTATELEERLIKLEKNQK
jgi:hypothetical protein